MSTSERATGSQLPVFTLGDHLRKAREHAGLEQGEFAQLIGVSRGTVSNYERDRGPAKPIVINAWAMATGVPIEWLRTGKVGDDDPSPGDGAPGMGLPPGNG